MAPPEHDAECANGNSELRAHRIGIDSSRAHVIYMRRDCHVCRSEGFGAHARIRVRQGAQSILATLNVVADRLLEPGQAGLSESAWTALGAEDGAMLELAHPEPVESLRYVRAKLHGQRLEEASARAIVQDALAGRYSDIELSAFLAASAGSGLDVAEVAYLTRAMLGSGAQLSWGSSPVADKHCVGGLPGNRTTLIVVPIVAAAGFLIPKTSSRAITSPAGTADTMATLAPVEHNLPSMRRIVEEHQGCIVWGGAMDLSPADDVFVRIERALDIDSPGQLVASILSKKAAAGSTHVLIDVPVGPTAKVRTAQRASELESLLTAVGRVCGLEVTVRQTDGTQPVGRGIGPALEARDALAVLTGAATAPADLRRRSLTLAGALLEQVGATGAGGGMPLATRLLEEGLAWRKFQSICEAQGGMREPPVAIYQQPISSGTPGLVTAIDNRRLGRVAKLAGAPAAHAAGVELHVRVGDRVEAGEPLYSIHAETPGELDYSERYARGNGPIFEIQGIE